MLAGLNRAAAPWRQTALRYQAWLLVALALCFALGVRWRLRAMPLERAEGECAYAGQLLLQGVLPYAQAYTTQLPGTCAAYAVIMAVFGQSPAGIHFGVTLVNAASIILMFLLGRRLLDEATGVAAAAVFGLLSLSPAVQGLAGHPTQFVVLTGLAGTWVLLRARQGPGSSPKPTVPRSEASVAAQPPADAALARGYTSRLPSPLFLAGLLLGLALALKLQGVFFGVIGALYLLRVTSGEWLAVSEVKRQEPGFRSLRERTTYVFTSPVSRAARARMLRALGIFALGWLLPFAVTCLALWVAGAFRTVVLWTLASAGHNPSAIPIVNPEELLRAFLSAVMGPDLLLWMLAFVGVIMMWWDKRLEHQTPVSPSTPQPPMSGLRHPLFLLAAWLFCSLAAVIPGPHFRAESFMLLLPVLALLAGAAVSRGLYLLRHDQTIELFLALPILGLFVVALGTALVGHGTFWLTLSPAEAMRHTSSTTLFAKAARAADYVKARTDANARIAVLGSEPELYFYARRRSACGQMYMYPLMAENDRALRLQDQMIREIERAQPEYVLYIDDPSSWRPGPNSPQRVFEWWKGYWARNLDLETTMEIDEGREAPEDADTPPKEQSLKSHILIFKRRQ